jgi:hypothetical protein
MRSRLVIVRVVIAALALVDARPAAAQAVPPTPALDKPAERRSGVVIGTAIGYGLAAASGYPNNGSLIGSPAYYSASGLMSGVNSSAFVMGALTDYVNVGLWLGGGTVQSKDWRSTSFGAGFRVEAFPLYGYFPKLRDLGIFTLLGFGRATLTTKLVGSYPSASGSQSFVGVGAFYEFSLAKLLGGHLAAGPSLEYDVINAASIQRHGGYFSGRIVFYGGK